MGVMNIDLRIEELVLRGFSALDREAIREAVETELRRLVETRGLDAREISIDAIDGGRFKVSPGARPQTTGAQIARSVYGSLSGKAGRSAGR
jgi:hypothetical protein